MDEANEFFNNIMSAGKDFNKCKLGKVVDFDAKSMKASIQPLPSNENSLLINVPVMTLQTRSFFIVNPLQEGDIVVVLFADNDLDNILLGSDNTATERKHDLSDSICIGGINLFNNSIDASNDDLVIATTDDAARVTISEEGNIDIKGQKISISGENVSISARDTVSVSGRSEGTSWE